MQWIARKVALLVYDMTRYEILKLIFWRKYVQTYKLNQNYNQLTMMRRVSMWEHVVVGDLDNPHFLTWDLLTVMLSRRWTLLLKKSMPSTKTIKKRKYNDRVLNNEHGSFTPLVFSINGGMSRENMLYHKQLAEKIATKTFQRYDQVMEWVRRKLSFLIMSSALLCLRGSRTIKVNTDDVDDFSFACDEVRLWFF